MNCSKFDSDMKRDIPDVILNDITMIDYAGLGVAMANGQDAVKSRADYITDTNDNDGVAKVIEKFILGMELVE